MPKKFVIEVWDVWESTRKIISTKWGIMYFDSKKEALDYSNSHLNGDRFPRNLREIKEMRVI